MKWGRMEDNKFLQEQFVDIFNSIECKFGDYAQLTHIPTSQTSIVYSVTNLDSGFVYRLSLQCCDVCSRV